MAEISFHSAVKYNRLDDLKGQIDFVKDKAALNELLVTACSSDFADESMLEFLISMGANPNSYISRLIGDSTYFSGTPLQHAAGHGHLGKVKTLLRLGADVGFKSPSNSSVLNSAVHAPHDKAEPVVKYLIACGAELNGDEKAHTSPIWSASRDGKFKLVKILLDAGADDSLLEWDELKHIIAYGTADACEQSIKRGSSLELRDGWNRTPFLLSVLAGDLNKCQLLHNHGANIADTGHCGATPLMYAVRKNNAVICEWLIKIGADIHQTDEFGRTVLLEASEYGAAECVHILLEAGADLHAETNTQTAAIENAANIETVKILKGAGADINRIGGDGYNLLKKATDRADYTFVRQILELGADPNTTSTGDIPLHFATRYDEIEIMRVLLQYGSNPNALDVDNETPLHRLKSVEAAKILTSAGARADFINIVGQTAVDYAEDEKIRSCLKSTILKK